jgi:ATP:ADP antiporter, AAA family
MALKQCRVRGTATNQGAIWNVIRNTVARATWASTALADLGEGENAGEAAGLLRRALEHDLLGCRERIFLALSFVYDEETLTHAWQEFAGGAPDKRAYALEIVDTLLSPEFRALVLPVLEPASEWQRARPHGPSGFRERLEALVRNEEGFASPWTRSCALYGIGKLAERRSAAVVAAALGAREPLVRETAAWALSRLKPRDLRERLEPLAADATDQVASVARTLIEDTARP